MQPPMENQSEPKISLPVVSVVFFGVYYLFLWLYVEPQLLYHHFEVCRRAPFFKTGWLFLQDSLSYPGGPSQYLAAFVTQLCYFSWLGALCITLAAWGIYRLTASLTAVAAKSPWRVICYVPALLILMVCGRYESPMRTAVAILVVGLFSVLYKKFSPNLGSARAILFLVFSGVLYWIAGSAALVFVALAALCEFFDRRRPLFSVFYLLLGSAVCWLLGAYVFELEAREIYVYSSPFISIRRNIEMANFSRLFEESLFVALPAVVLLANLGRRLAETSFFSRPRKRALRGKPSIADKILYHFYKGKLRWITQMALLFLVAVPSILLPFDRESKKTVQVDYFACRGMWQEVLATSGGIPMKRYFPFCPHAVNRALYYTGRLGDQLFACPQNYHTRDLMFSVVHGGNVVFMDRAEMCLELGLVNVAEKIAYEFLGGADDSPFILKQLALINLVKGRIETARVFLRALSRNLIYGGEGKDILRRLESDPLLEKDERIKHLRSIMMTTDYIYGSYDGTWLEELLRRNRYNKMAFEYLMAYYLMTKQLDKFVENLPRLDDFGYKSVPRHYQEAIVLYIGMTKKNVDLGGRKMNTDTIKQYNELNRIGEQFSYDGNVAWRALAPRFGRTYYFYFTFGVSGVWQ